MKKLIFLSILIAVLAAFFASTHPDGLDKTAETLGFAQKGVEHQAVMIGYSIPLLPESGLTTATAGIAGALITLTFFWLAAYVLKSAN